MSWVKAELRNGKLVLREGADLRELSMPPSRVAEVRAIRVDGDNVSIRVADGRVYRWTEYGDAGGKWVLAGKGDAPPWPTIG